MMVNTSQVRTSSKNISELQKQYLKAFQENVRAEHNLKRLQADSRPSEGTTSSGLQENTLSEHLEVIGLRQQNRRLEILLDYTSKVRSLIESTNFDQHPAASTAVLEERSNVQELELQLEKLSRKLEMALIQANHQLQVEKRHVSQLKSQHVKPDAATKLNALEVTRAELTRWIETSLAKCDTETTPTRHSSLPSHRVDIDGQYEEYIKQRERLLLAVNALSEPLPPIEVEAGRGDRSVGRMTTNSVVPLLETIARPLLSESYELARYVTHLQDTTFENKELLKEQLVRLSEESHLLSSYPILHHKDEKDGDEIMRLLRQWSFAIDAAHTSTSANIEKLYRAGLADMNSVEDVLASIKSNDEMWEILQSKV